MFNNDHAPPHFHAYHGEEEAVVDIRDGSLLQGSLRKRENRLVMKWLELHQAELLKNWKLLREDQDPTPIEPLE